MPLKKSGQCYIRVQICLLSSVEFLCFVCRNDVVWFLYLVLKLFSVSLMNVSVVLFYLHVMVVWKISDDWRQFPLSGHTFFCRQLQVFLSFVLMSSVMLYCRCVWMNLKCICCGY